MAELTTHFFPFQESLLTMSEQANEFIIAKLTQRISQLESRLTQQDIMNAAFQSQIGNNQGQINGILCQFFPNTGQNGMTEGLTVSTQSSVNTNNIVNGQTIAISPIGSPKRNRSPTASVAGDSPNSKWGDMVDLHSEINNSLNTSMNSNQSTEDNTDTNSMINGSTDDVSKVDKAPNYANAVGKIFNTVSEEGGQEEGGGESNHHSNEDDFNLVSYKSKINFRLFTFEYYLTIDKLKSLIDSRKITIKLITEYDAYQYNTIYYRSEGDIPMIIASRDLTLPFANIKPVAKLCDKYGCTGFMCPNKHENHHNMYPIGLDRFEDGICVLSFMGYKSPIEFQTNHKVFRHRIKDIHKKDSPSNLIELLGLSS